MELVCYFQPVNSYDGTGKVWECVLRGLKWHKIRESMHEFPFSRLWLANIPCRDSYNVKISSSYLTLLGVLSSGQTALVYSTREFNPEDI